MLSSCKVEAVRLNVEVPALEAKSALVALPIKLAVTNNKLILCFKSRGLPTVPLPVKLFVAYTSLEPVAIFVKPPPTTEQSPAEFP
jgi:hypothetical protein